MKKTNFVKRKKNTFKKKHCLLCAKGIYYVDYKNVELLKSYINFSGKIIPRRVTGLCQKHQRIITNCIKRARIVALLPFIKKD
ncbi:30S ribosomal protein S18 [bacterium]|nr:30S ribosomal protein S18 [bacterium]